MYSMDKITERLLTNFYVNKISTVKKEDGKECNFIGLINGKKIGLDYDKERDLISVAIWESWEQKEEQQEEDLHKQRQQYLINRNSLDDLIKIHAQGLFGIRCEKSANGKNVYAKVYNVDNYLIYEFDWEKEEDDDSVDSYIHAARSHGFLLVNFCSDRAEAFLI